MSKKKKYEDVPERSETEGKSTSDFYSLKSDAVDRLVNANVANSPEVSEEEIRKLTGKKKIHISMAVKAVIFKFWFAGAVCFFFGFGLGNYLSQENLILVLGAGLGAVKDLLENNALRFFEKTEGEASKYMFISTKKYWSIFLNVPYGLLILFVIIRCYELINLALASMITDFEGFGYEPLLFGLLAMGIDFGFIGIKKVFKKIVDDARKTVDAGKNNLNK